MKLHLPSMKKAYRTLLTMSLAALFAISAGCGEAILPAAASAEPEATAATITSAPTATPTATPLPTSTPTPEPKNRSQTSGAVIPEGTPSKPLIVSIDNADGAKPQTGLNEADIVYEFLVEQTITRFHALYNDFYPVYGGPVRSTRYYMIDLVQEWDCMYLLSGYVVLDDPYRRIPGRLVSLYLPSGDFRGYSNNYSARNGAMDDYEAKNGYKFRAPESGRGDVHALYFRLEGLVTNFYGDHEAQVHERFRFMENVSYEYGEAFSRVSLQFDNDENPNWIEFAYDQAANRLYRSESGQKSMSRTVTEQGSSYTEEQINVQNLIVQYCQYGMIKGDNKHRRSCELIGEGKCDYFINGQHVTGTWSRPTAEDYTSYLLEDGSLVILEPGNTWIAVHPADQPAAIE